VALTESIKIIKTTKEHIHSTKIEGSAQAKAIDDKIKKILKKKVGFYQLQKISKILKEKNESKDRLPADISSSNLPFFKFAPISFVDVERFFSKYKNIFADNKRLFEFLNSRKYLIVQCYCISMS
jgi:hypothetical protein